MNDHVAIRFDPGDLPARLDNAERQADAKVLVGLARIATHGQALARALAPVHSGKYRDSLHGRLLHHPTAVEVRSSSRLAHIIQGGRSPGRMPPPKAIASRFGLPVRPDGYLIARRIAQTGTDGVDVLRLVHRSLEPLVAEVRHDIAADIGSLGKD